MGLPLLSTVSRAKERSVSILPCTVLCHFESTSSQRLGFSSKINLVRPLVVNANGQVFLAYYSSPISLLEMPSASHFCPSSWKQLFSLLLTGSSYGLPQYLWDPVVGVVPWEPQEIDSVLQSHGKC